MPGTFTISLDFELFWGVHDKRTLADYGHNILGAREAIPRMLEAFDRYGIHCTWAIVGFLFFDDKEELLQYLPQELPRYANPALSPYPRIARIGPTERQDPYHFGLSLVRRIKDCPHQEIGSHTFSHYYCLEDGQTPEAFRADLEAARRAAGRLGITMRSLVFPRNQFSAGYLGICRDAGIEAVRGNQLFRFFRSKGEARETLIRKVVRRLDQYLPLSGANGVAPELDSSGTANIRASRFLLAVPNRSRIFGPLAQRRINAAMTDAARTGRMFHLWWHPHNFGSHVDDNMAILRQLLEHYRALAQEHGMVSRNMAEVAAAMREGLSHGRHELQPAGPTTDAVTAARVSISGT